MLLIRYPQPDAIYTVRWSVPDDFQGKQLTDAQARNLIALRNAFSNPDHRGVQLFYDRISFLLRRQSGWDNLLFYLIGYNEDRKTLCVVRGPDTPRPYWPLRVGRGASGTAFKMLRPEYYEKGSIKYAAAGESTHYVEALYEGFDPDALLAIPLVYPQCMSSCDDGEVLYGRSFAVLAVAAKHPAPALVQYSPLRSPSEGGLDAVDLQLGIGRLWNLVDDALREHAGDIVPALK